MISRATYLNSFFLSVISFSAWAQNPCAQDVAKYCPGVAGPEVAKCLLTQDSKLSVECKQEVQRRVQLTKGGLSSFGGVMGSFGILPPTKKVLQYNGNFAGINQQKVSFATPVWSHDKESLSMSLNGSSIAFNEVKNFKDSTIRTPNELQRVEVGAQYSRRLKDKKAFGLRTSVGSASDKILYGMNEMTFSVNATYSFPGENENHWIWTVFMSNNNPLANYVPIPGFIYLYKKENFTGMFGLPFLSMQWTPVKPVVLSMSYFITNLNTEAAYGFNDHMQLFTGFSIAQQTFLRKDREQLQQRLFFNEKKVFVGFRTPLSKSLNGDIQVGRAFDRRLQEGRRFNNTKYKADFDSSYFVGVNVNFIY